jgi:hypothetical protein
MTLGSTVSLDPRLDALREFARFGKGTITQLGIRVAAEPGLHWLPKTQICISFANAPQREQLDLRRGVRPSGSTPLESLFHEVAIARFPTGTRFQLTLFSILLVDIALPDLEYAGI